MRVAIPHSLEREEVRRRFRENSHKLSDHMPGGVAEVHTEWPHENRMNLAIGAMGQSVSGHVDIEEQQVVFEVALPAALSFVEPMIKGAIENQTQRLLEKKQD